MVDLLGDGAHGLEQGLGGAAVDDVGGGGGRAGQVRDEPVAAGELALLHRQAGVEVEELHEVPVVFLPQRAQYFTAGGEDFDVVLEDHAPRGVGP